MEKSLLFKTIVWQYIHTFIPEHFEQSLSIFSKISEVTIEFLVSLIGRDEPCTYLAIVTSPEVTITSLEIVLQKEVSKGNWKHSFQSPIGIIVLTDDF